MIDNVLGKIAAHKKREVDGRRSSVDARPGPTAKSLRQALSRPGARFIMEVKKASPSGHRSHHSVEQAVAAYAPIADAISVLTDKSFFGGSLADLETVRKSFDGPILAKDFIVDPIQVTEARAHGADAVLVIMAMLSDDEAKGVMDAAATYAMDVLVEVHDEAELERAIALGAAIIGINNRDLKTLKTDLAVTERLAPLVPADRLAIAESGIAGRADVERLSLLVDGFLVGSSLMAASDIACAARGLVFGPVKICGLTRREDVAKVAEAGATYAGFIFAPGTPRAIEGEGRELVGEARRHGLSPVGVFRGQHVEEVAARARELGLDAVQVHGSQDMVEQLRPMLPDGCAIWAACAVGETVEPQRAGADRTIFDTRIGGTSGGSGLPFDWSLLAGRDDLASGFVAGGIGPDNARSAQALGAYGIDVGSALEAAPRIKDHAKIDRLFDALRLPSRGDMTCA